MRAKGETAPKLLKPGIIRTVFQPPPKRAIRTARFFYTAMRPGLKKETRHRFFPKPGRMREHGNAAAGLNHQAGR